MGEECKEQCSSCSKECSDRREKNKFLVNANEFSHVKKVIGIVSGKGGVGKSLITSLLASEMKKKGQKVAILDADITGPSIPKAFGITGKAYGTETGIIPLESKNGIKIMSLNLLMEHETDPVIWRGPILANTVKQFWSEVVWDEVDYMFVDMPPGTSDVPLTVFQSLPLDGIVVVTSPQELVSMIVAKAVHMANQMHVPILGLVENMSYMECPNCKEKLSIFGESKIETVASDFSIDTFAKLPIVSKIAKACDNGTIEEINGNFVETILNKIERM